MMTSVPTPLGKVLVLNSHEAWVHQLEGLGLNLEIAVGLGGRGVEGWDSRMRPVPEGAVVRRIEDVLAAPSMYSVVVAHSLTDLLEVRGLDAPKLLVVHTTLEGRAVEQSSQVTPDDMRRAARTYVEGARVHVVSCSSLKRRSAGLGGDVVSFGIDVDDYPPATCEAPRGVRISNHFDRRRKILLGDLHDEAFDGLPFEWIGEGPGSRPSADWSDLKRRLGASRFYVHTANPALEDGYNMASLEAMACGLPVLGNLHPSSPIVDGLGGFLSDDPDVLRARAEELLGDRELALRMGRANRERVARLFGAERFRAAMNSVLRRAAGLQTRRPVSAGSGRQRRRR